ncbi:hypothetical protein LSAT2_018937 [Lamellibrachia satsuma]|nr:hypothetical protein LSAT2_018937 [Lamellibrachia satsuma]
MRLLYLRRREYAKKLCTVSRKNQKYTVCVRLGRLTRENDLNRPSAKLRKDYGISFHSYNADIFSNDGQRVTLLVDSITIAQDERA